MNKKFLAILCVCVFCGTTKADNEMQKDFLVKFQKAVVDKNLKKIEDLTCLDGSSDIVKSLYPTTILKEVTSRFPQVYAFTKLSKSVEAIEKELAQQHLSFTIKPTCALHVSSKDAPDAKPYELLLGQKEETLLIMGLKKAK